MKDILQDEKTNRELEEKGFVILPYLNRQEVQTLYQIFTSLVDELPQHFYATTHSPDKEFRKNADRKMQEVLQTGHQKVLKQGQALGGAFISKPPGPAGILPLHQDWNIVDEKKSRSFNIWIPLIDVDEKNGAVQVLEASHNKMESYRGPGIPPLLANISKHVLEQMRSLGMKAGEALIYDHALWHASPENQSSEVRPAVVCGMIPQNAPMRLYFGEGEQINEYEGYPNYFFENDLGAGSTGLKKLRQVNYQAPQMDEKEFDRIFLGLQPKKKFNLFSKLKWR